MRESLRFTGLTGYCRKDGVLGKARQGREYAGYTPGVGLPKLIMMRSSQIVFVVLLVLFLAGCAGVGPGPTATIIPGDPNAPSQVTPQQALATAQLYCTHAWHPFASNIKHGLDPAGVRVDTPDVSYLPANGRNGWWIPGEVNEGIPYKWGGFDNPEMFDNAISAGGAGGDVSTPGKRQADNAAVSQYAAGVDCSGFVSRCLNLPALFDSAGLPAICDPLPGPQQLQPGDLLNIPHQHVILVAGWASADHTMLYYYETGGIPTWRPMLKVSPLAKLIGLGFQPLHYRGMAREELPSGKEILTRGVRSRAVVVANPVVGAP
jgi:hypothetical protein